MEFEWDEEKRISNIEKHDVDMVEAVLIFEGFTFIEQDPRDYGEVRWKATGIIDEECFILIFTDRGDARRLISAWKGGRRDRAKYQARYSRRYSSDERSR